MFKNYILIIAATFFATQLSAQNFDKVKFFLTLNKIEDAQKEYEKIIVKTPAAADKVAGVFWNLRLMYFIQKDENLKTKIPIDPIKYKELLDKYLLLDDTLQLMKTDFASEPLFDIYSKSYKSAIENFNAKKWDLAIASFQDAIKYSTLIYSNRFTTAPANTFDTTSFLYLGYACQNSSKFAEALNYYKKFLDNKIIVDENTVEIYKFCLIQYIDSKDKQNFYKYLAICKEVFPKTNWADYEGEFVRLNFSLNDITNAYNEKLSTNKLTEKELIEYADIFTNAKEKDSSLNNTELENYISKAIEAYTKANAVNPNNYLVTFNLGVLFQNKMDRIQEKYNENIKKMQEINQPPITEKDPKKKAAISAERTKKINEIKGNNEIVNTEMIEIIKNSISWFEKSYKSLKEIPNRTGKERNLINKSVDILSSSFELLRDKARGKDVKLFDEYDAKVKLYDDLHGKF